MNQYTFLIPEDIGDTKLYALVGRMLPQLPRHVVREAFDRRDVKMDGLRANRETLAMPGAKVLIYSRHALQAFHIPVVYEDEDVLLVHKPAGISCEADAKGGLPVTAVLAEQGNAAVGEPLLCHRLDNQTEGLLLLAKTAQTQEALWQAFRERRIHKAYQCLVQGTPDKAHATESAFLLKDASRARVQVMAEPKPGARTIVTEYQVLQRGEIGRLRVQLHTGRTHQIRAHMAFLGHPLLGDDLYGNRAFNREKKVKRLMLCATELVFSLEGRLAYLNQRQFSVKPHF